MEKSEKFTRSRLKRIFLKIINVEKYTIAGTALKRLMSEA